MPTSADKQYFEYTIRDSTIKTVGDLLNAATGSFISLIKETGDTSNSIATKFVSYDGNTNLVGFTNLNRILSKYYTDSDSTPNQDAFNGRTDYENFPIVFGTTVLLDWSWIDRDIIKIFGDAISSIDTNAFTADALKRWYTNPANVRTFNSTKKTLGTYKEMFNHISVWVWCKALNSKVSKSTVVNQTDVVSNGQLVSSESRTQQISDIQYDDVLLDITPYVNNLNTNMTGSGGSFTFVVDPILAAYDDKKNSWVIDNATTKKFKNNEYVAHSHIADDIQRKSFFFHNILQENDVVFIRFETLESEEDRLNPKKDFQLSASDIQWKSFDMIGLIDVQNQASSFANNDVTITVSGRDLMKLFIEDGVYFYPFDFIGKGIFANADSDDERLNRYDGQLINRFEQSFKKIENILNFIINALGTIKICSDDLFLPYKNQGILNTSPTSNVISITEEDKLKYDRRTFHFNQGSENGIKPLRGIWQIVKLLIDFTVQDRLVADSSIGNEHGSLINAIKKVCQEPFVEFFGDTIGDQYYLTVRKPPFDREGFLNLLDGTTNSEQNKNQLVSHEPMIIELKDEDILDEQLQYGAEAFSWYHLTPQGNFQGGEDMAFAYLRAVYFKEYADIFGSRPLDLVTNYIPYQPIVNGGEQLGNAYMIKQACYDLQYMIQSNAYLPFVRRGTITIANGNRKIKRGTLIKLASTGEVGFVETVQHSAAFNLNSIERITTIGVDRLMVEDYIRGVDVQDSNGKIFKASYFELIDTTIDKAVFANNTSFDVFNNEIIGKWKVNADVFNFFLKSRQFNTSISSQGIVGPDKFQSNNIS